MLHHLPLDYQPPAEPIPEKPVAVLVCHGMGQQVPFETLASLADRLSDHSRFQDQQVRHVCFADPASVKREVWLPRAEITVANPEHPKRKRRPVHVYEAYWAPLTEGNISLTDVGRFLGAAGWNGISFTFAPFLRWLFGEDRKFKIPQSTLVALLGTLLLIVALVAINGVLTLVVGENLLDIDALGTTPPVLVNALTQDLAGLLLVAAVAGGSLALSTACRNTAARRLADALAWLLLGVACLSLVGIAVLMVVDYFQLRDAAAAPEPLLGLTDEWRLLLIGLVWALALLGSWKLRGFFVQYLGDVAIYIDAYKVDRYHKIRGRIREQAYRTACAIYGARQRTEPGQTPPDNPPFLYDRVVVVGHSLGSVIAHDALNASLVLDETLDYQLAVRERTQALITFGSPLDKTAYIFHAKQPKNSLRASLRASAQPLIRDAQVREAIDWFNIYSPADVISGRLQFYDYPPYEERAISWRVRNLHDPDANTPVVAHSQYWDNKLLADTIARAIFAPQKP